MMPSHRLVVPFAFGVLLLALSSLSLAATPIACPETGPACSELTQANLSDFKFPLNVAEQTPTCKLEATFKLAFTEDGPTAPPPGPPVGECMRDQKAPEAAKVANYNCTITAPDKVKSGSLTAFACAGNDRKLVIPVKGAVSGGSGASPASSADGGTPAIEGLGFLPLATWQHTLTQLQLPLADHSLGHYYSRRRDVAVLFFDADATPYFPLLDEIDEDDDIFVAIVDKEKRLEGAEISLQGCDRPPVEPRIYGAGLRETLDAGLKGTAEEREREREKLTIILRAFGKCAGAASGGPVLSIKHHGSHHSSTIRVNPLYRLAVGIAFGYDATRTREFNVRTAAGDTVPRIAQSKDRVGVTPMVYVSFYPIARDFRKRDFFLAQRLQLFVGLDTADFMKNVIVGAGYELSQGLSALVGWRALTKQPILAEGSGLASGSSFDGTSEAIPTRERWETGSVFFGLGLNSDLFSRLR